MAVATRRVALPAWLAVVGPLVFAGVLLLLLVGADLPSRFHGGAPVDAVAVERTVLEPGVIRMHLRNDGTAPVTISQVMVNDAFWDHTVSPRTIGRLGTATVTVPYPWEESRPLQLGLLTSTGVTIAHQVEAATLSPDLGGRALGDYALLGFAIGVVPVALGLLWLPAVRRAPARWLRFFLALTVGLLAFLLVETVDEGLSQAGKAASSLRGVEVFALGFIAVVAAMAWVQGRMGRRGQAGAPSAALALAYLVAVGIGLHNLGEGLAVGSALATGEVALGTSLIVGFALHNTTEGLAIVSPLGGDGDAAPVGHLVALALVAGGPAVPGAWFGAFAVTPAWASLALGVAAGAIAQVLWVVGRRVLAEDEGVSGPSAVGFLVGVAVMYLTALATA